MATLFRIDSSPASAEVEATMTQFTSPSVALVPMVAIAVWQSVLSALTPAAFQKDILAGIKEMGAFDTDMGRSTQDYINAEEYETAAEKLKGVVTDRGYRDDLIGRAPELADEITWVSIWEAAKRKAAAETNLHGEDLLNKAGEIFTECIVNTQVYDSVLSRSGLMRSKDTGVKMATAFMAEPTTAINMLMDAVINKSRGNSQMAAREIGAGAAAITLNAILQSVIYAMRDDDDDESYAEKYTASLVDNLKSGYNPLNMVPFFRDLVSIANGYDVERSDIWHRSR